MDKLVVMPLGTIIAWVIKPEKDADHSATLLDGWMRCDGSLIPPPSPWAGKLTPNLNNDNLFLRGGHDTEYLDTEDDQIQDLQLSLVDPGHTHSDNGHQHGGIEDKYYWPDRICDTKCTGDYYVSDWDKDNTNENYNTRTVSTSTGHASLKSSSSGIKLTSSEYRKGSETRPANAKTIWIIRVW